MTLKLQKRPKNLKTTQNGEKMHYKITIFGACAPYPRLIYWTASSISQGKKDDMSSKFRHCSSLINYTTIHTYKHTIINIFLACRCTLLCNMARLNGATIERDLNTEFAEHAHTKTHIRTQTHRRLYYLPST